MVFSSELTISLSKHYIHYLGVQDLKMTSLKKDLMFSSVLEVWASPC